MISALEIDRRLQEYVSARRKPKLTQIMIGFTSLGSSPVIGVVLLFAYFLGTSNQFITLSAGVLLTTAAVQIVKYFSARERPENQVIKASFASSFPSGHSASSFAVATMLSSFYPEVLPLSFALASLVALSRVYLGEHFLSDIVAGSALGIVIAYVVLSLV